METCKIPTLNKELSRLAIGSWTIRNDAQFMKLISAAFERGINVIDTAESYGKGHSEMLIGRAIKDHNLPREGLVIMSKFTHNHSEPRLIRKSLERSLKRLQTDYIDIYFQHWPPKRPPLQETIDTLISLKEEGLIRAVGVSNWREREWNEIKDHSLIDCYQPCYNLLWREIEGIPEELCKKDKIAIFPHSPLCGGLLTGRAPGARTVLCDREEVKNEVEKLKRLSSKYQITPAQLALGWLLKNDLVTAPIIGVSSLEHLEEALLSFKVKELDIDLNLRSFHEIDQSLWGPPPRSH